MPCLAEMTATSRLDDGGGRASTMSGVLSVVDDSVDEGDADEAILFCCCSCSKMRVTEMSRAATVSLGKRDHSVVNRRRKRSVPSTSAPPRIKGGGLILVILLEEDEEESPAVPTATGKL
jgi:hypothetical protein